ncbi:hypothetical protein EJB05_14192, partial [Eragrostis curvula]
MHIWTPKGFQMAAGQSRIMLGPDCCRGEDDMSHELDQIYCCLVMLPTHSLPSQSRVRRGPLHQKKSAPRGGTHARDYHPTPQRGFKNKKSRSRLPRFTRRRCRSIPATSLRPSPPPPLLAPCPSPTPVSRRAFFGEETAASCGHGGGKGPRFQDTAAGHAAFFCFTLLLALRVDGRTAARAEMASAAAAGVGTADLRAWKWVMGRAGGRGRRARPAPRPPPHPQLRRHRNRRGIGDKNLLRPQPRLRTGFFSVLECSMIPAGYIPEACTSVGAAKYGRPLGLDERIKVDLIVIGLVAVDPNSGAWLGKGETAINPVAQPSRPLVEAPVVLLAEHDHAIDAPIRADHTGARHGGASDVRRYVAREEALRPGFVEAMTHLQVQDGAVETEPLPRSSSSDDAGRGAEDENDTVAISPLPPTHTSIHSTPPGRSQTTPNSTAPPPPTHTPSPGTRSSHQRQAVHVESHIDAALLYVYAKLAGAAEVAGQDVTTTMVSHAWLGLASMPSRNHLSTCSGSHALDAAAATTSPITGDSAGHEAEDESDAVAVSPTPPTSTQATKVKDDADLKPPKTPPRSSSSTRRRPRQAQDDVVAEADVQVLPGPPPTRYARRLRSRPSHVAPSLKPTPTWRAYPTLSCQNILGSIRGYLISKRSMLLQYILQVDNQSNSVRALQSAHRISDNQQAQRIPGAHCQPCPPHLLPLEKWNWWEVDWDSLGEERELLVFVRALKMFRDEVLSRVNAMASALLLLPWKEKQQQ